MKSKTLGLLIAIVLVVLLAAPVGALPAPDQAVPAPDTGVYIVRFEGASLAAYEGDIAGLEATSPAVTGAAKLDVKSPASLAYLDYLANRHAQFVAAMERTLDRSVEVLFRYDVVLNGMAVRMTAQEAAQVAALPGVVDVQAETIEQPDTVDSVPWIGAPSIWDGSAVPGGSGTYGEGVIVGVLDTGINSDHPSFAATGPVDGYIHINPYGPGVYKGYCATNPGFCNDKLIGAWNYTDGPEDTNGHGSHTASTAAGNFVSASITTPSGYVVNATISGVAPHANVIMYDVCDAGGCGSGDSVAAINQAVLDGVDAINFSISGGNNPYGDSVELAFLDANTAGIFVSTSAGNNGPGAATVAHRSPWVSTVAAGTHNRLYTNQVISMSGGITPPADITGQSISTGYGPAPIVYAGAAPYNNPLCAPFTGTPFSGQIVVCDRGTYGRVEKGQNVLNAGGGGYILANDATSGASLVADAHVLPASHITYDDGVILKTWLASGSGHQGTITTTGSDLSPANGDIMADFSSRGPNTTFDVLKPDMSAPGVAVLAASMNTIEYEWMGGTSMSSPHNAGAGALMKALYPSWTPSEIKSAIMTTSETDNLRKEDGVTPADPFDVGAGRDDLMYAALAGIVFDETRANYLAANPSSGGDPKTLNVPSMQNNNCAGTCSWTRVVSSTQSAAVTWTAAGTGMGFTFSPASFSLSAGGTQQIVITANTSGLPVGSWAFGEVTLTPSNPAIPAAHLPVAVIPQTAPTDPVIAVDPESIDTTQQVDTMVTHPLAISNDGGSALDWSIFEELGVLGGAVLVDWFDNFDSYATDISLHGVGGWKGWANDPAAAAYTRDEQARSAPNSVEIVNVNDTVHEYTGYTSGVWAYTAWQYIPTDFAGESYFILLNQYYDVNPPDNNWSTQVNFNGTTNTVVNDGPAGGTLPLVRGQWMEIRVEIDLDNDIQSFYYGGDLLFTGSWTDGQSGGGILNIAAVDLWGNEASAVYYDDLSLVAVVPACSAPSEIPWVSVDPISGTTEVDASSAVDVIFDTTGLTVGNTYEGNLCVESNDPVNPLVVVPLALTVVADAPDISVDPDSLHSTQYTDMMSTLPLTICNVGDAALSWELSEQSRTVPTALPQVALPPAVIDPDSVVDLVGGAESAAPAAIEGGVIWEYPEAVLYDNGPLVTLPGVCGGMDASRLQTDLAMNTLGFGNQLLNNNHMADDFEVTGDGWQIDQITFFAYQTNAPVTPSPITGLYYQIWDGPPNDPSSSVVWGDLTTNRLLSSASPNMQRDSGTSPCANNRYIFANVASAGVSLPPGTYWLDWITDGSLASGPWAPPITIIGQTTTGNALQYTSSSGAWAPANDSGTLTQQGMPFIIEGTGGGAEDVPWLSEDPILGIVEPGLCQVVDVSFDSTGLTPGDYYADLLADSNDPDTPQVVVPVTLTVLAGEPDVVVDPLELTAEVCPDATAVVTFTVCNTGLVPLDWSLVEVEPVVTLADSLPAAAAVSRAGRTVELSLDAAPVPGGSVNTAPPATNAAVSLVIDDGTAENNIGIGGTWEFIYLNRFTPDPGEYPFSLDQVQVYFDSAGLALVGDDIILVVYENTTGGYDPAVGSNWLASFPTTVQALDAWNVYDLAAPVLLDGPGDVLIGVVALEVPGTSYWPAAMDQTTTQQRSWAGWWSTTPPPTPPTLPPDDSWILIDDYFPGNWMIRGYGETYEFDIPWLSEDPITGTVQPGECQEVAVTFDATGMAPGDYFGALLIESNDPDTPEITIPVTMTVLEPAAIVSVTYTVDGLEVTFDATATGAEPLAYAWDFGDDATSTDEDPVHVYEAGGCYTATLTVSNGCGEDTWTEQICVCEPVHGLDFSWLPEFPIVNEEVLFTATALGTEPITFDWDFGDGHVGTGITVTHVYTAAGDYVVTVTAANCEGATETITDTITVSEEPIPVFRFFLPVVMKNN